MSTTTTNTKNLPVPFIEALSFSDWTPVGNMSLHRIVDAPQIFKLKKANEIEEDVSDKVWQLINRALLQVIENGNEAHRNRRAFSTVTKALIDIQNHIKFEDDNYSEEQIAEHNKALTDIVNALDKISTEHFPPSDDDYMIRQSYGVTFEESYTCHKGTDKEFTSKESATIFDTIPLYDKVNRKLMFIKVCSTYHITLSDLRHTWIREANIQAYILQMNGFPVESIEAVAIMKDWSKGKVGIQQDYPKSQLETMQLPLHKSEDTEKVIKVQLRRHLRSQAGDNVLCTANERWAEADSWVVIRPNAKKPSKRCQSEKEATDYLAVNRSKLVDAIVKKENGKSKRCESYCPVRDVCGQWAEIRKSQTKEIQE